MSKEKVNVNVNEVLISYMKEFFASNTACLNELKTLIADSKANDLNHYSLRLYLVSSKTSTKTANIKYRNVSLPDNKLTNGFLPVTLKSLEEILEAGK